MRLLTVLLLALSAQAEIQFASLGSFRLDSGLTLHDCRIGYQTFGKLNDAKSNAVLFPTWFTGTSNDLRGNIGPGKLIDSDKYFVIAADAIGDGISTSPSNSKTQPHLRFPKFTTGDMVRSQYLLVTGTLHLKHLHAVMGISMGGMQTFQWMVDYPDFFDKAIPIVGSPQLTTTDLLLWNAELHAIEAAKPPRAGMRAVADMHAFALTTPNYRATETTPAAAEKFMSENEQNTPAHFAWDDWTRQLEAMIGHDIAKASNGSMESAAAKVKAKTLVIVGLQDHMVNPLPALSLARLLHCETLEIDSPCGHLTPGCDQTRVAAAIARFLQ